MFEVVRICVIDYIQGQLAQVLVTLNKLIWIY